ncbi:unnamed protein product, partial [Adineta steineri]
MSRQEATEAATMIT